jgi:hypothetical protein
LCRNGNEHSFPARSWQSSLFNFKYSARDRFRDLCLLGKCSSSRQSLAHPDANSKAEPESDTDAFHSDTDAFHSNTYARNADTDAGVYPYADTNAILWRGSR